MSDEYEFSSLPIDGIKPGTCVLVSGPVHGGARDLAFQLLNGPINDGTLIITTNKRAARIVEECRRAGVEVTPERTAVLDCVGEEGSSLPAQVLAVSQPSDLTGIGMRYSDVYRSFRRDGIDHARTGFYSVSTLLSLGDVKTIWRFVHTLVGRISAVDGFGVFLVDPSIHDEQTVSTLTQFFAGVIEVRETDDTFELRTRGLSGQSRDWTEFELALD